MVLPTIVRTAEESLRAVPISYREGALALGATRFQTVLRVVLPSALPGIGTGIVLAIGRSVGESAALLLTAGAALGVPRNLSDPARSMAVHLYLLASEGISMEKAYGTASVLIFLIIVVNAVANHLARRQGAKVRRSA
jgi:phosphate transport system permease protein